MTTDPSAGETTLVVSTDDAATEAAQLEAGGRLGRYVVLERVGTGGMGDVYRAYDSKLKREVALKLLKTSMSKDAGASARLMREAMAMARLSHPNVLPVFDVSEDGGKAFLSMEYVEGQTLSDWSKSENRPLDRILEVFRAAGLGLAAAHDAGFVHRDFKPSNVMIGEDGRVRVMDFGLVRLEADEPPAAGIDDDVEDEPLSQSLTLNDSVMGTPLYMAPEQHYGETIGPPADQYAFFVSLFFALYGAHPFGNSSLKELTAAKAKGPPSFPRSPRLQVPDFVRRAMTRGLSPDPAKRHPDMRAALDALRPRRSKATGWLLLGIGAAVGVGITMASRSSSEDPCLSTDALLEGTWSHSRADAVRTALGSAAAFDAEPLSETTVKAIDGWSTAWASEYTSACRLRSTQAKTATARLACLERHRIQASATVDRLTTVSTQDDVDAAHGAVGALKQPGACLFVAVEDSNEVDPPAVAALDADLATLTAELAFLKGEEGVRQAQDLVAQADGLGQPAVQIRAARTLARALLFDGQSLEAAEVHRTAFFKATELGDRQTAAELAVRLSGLVGDDLKDPDEGLLWSRYAAAAADPNDTATLGDLRLQRGRIRYRRGDFAGALEDAETAQRLLTATHGLQHKLVQSSINNQATALYELERLEESQAKFRESLQLQEELLGDAHPLYAGGLINFASSLAKSGNLDEALELYTRAETVLEGVDPEHRKLVHLYGNIGAVHGMAGRVEEANRYFASAVARSGDPTEELPPTVNLAMSEFALERYEQASKTIRRAIELQRGLDPQSAELPRLYELDAHSLRALERHDESAASWGKALRAAQQAAAPPSRIAGLRGELGRTYHQLGDADEARRNLELALALSREHPDALTAETQADYQALLDAL